MAISRLNVIRTYIQIPRVRAGHFDGLRVVAYSTLWVPVSIGPVHELFAFVTDLHFSSKCGILLASGPQE